MFAKWAIICLNYIHLRAENVGKYFTQSRMIYSSKWPKWTSFCVVLINAADKLNIWQPNEQMPHY